jgi:hypothetical protein
MTSIGPRQARRARRRPDPHAPAVRTMRYKAMRKLQEIAKSRPPRRRRIKDRRLPDVQPLSQVTQLLVSVDLDGSNGTKVGTITMEDPQ